MCGSAVSADADDIIEQSSELKQLNPAKLKRCVVNVSMIYKEMTQEIMHICLLVLNVLCCIYEVYKKL